MKVTEAWRVSRMPYREIVYRSLAEERGRMWWGAFGRTSFGKEAQSDFELTQRALRIARFDKLIVATFCVLSSVMPFTTQFFGSRILGLTSSISLSLAVSFGFTTLYAIQTLSSFVSAESSVLVSTLPLSKDDFSRITLFSFVRSVDYMVVGSVICQSICAAYLTASPFATLLMFVASLMNSVFAITAAFWFSKIFHRNLMRGGRSKSGTVFRLVLIFMWGSLLLGVGLLLSVPWYIVPQLEMALSSFDPLSSLFFLILYPFSAGVTIANLVYPNPALSAALIASVAMIGYMILAGIAGKWSLKTVERVSKEAGSRIARVAAKDFSIKTRGPVLGYVLKDLRISSRNPATAFFFALPVLETLIISSIITNYSVLRVSSILTATVTGGIFALLMPLALLNAEGAGLEYTKTLPVNAAKILTSKTLISTATYVPVPLTLVAMTFIKQITVPSAILIPVFTTLAIAAASIFEIKLFLDSAAKGIIAALIHDMKKLTVGAIIIAILEVAYGATYFMSVNYILATLIMVVTAVTELAVAVYSAGLLKQS